MENGIAQRWSKSLGSTRTEAFIVIQQQQSCSQEKPRTLGGFHPLGGETIFVFSFFSGDKEGLNHGSLRAAASCGCSHRLFPSIRSGGG